MIRSIPLKIAPTARDVQTILLHLEEELRKLGAIVQRSPYGAIRFRFPPPWKAAHLGILHAVTSGHATMGAAAGEPWRVRYELKFTTLQWTAVFLTALIVATVFQTGKFVAFYALVGVWLVAYVIPYVAATLRFRRLVTALVSDVVQKVVTGAHATRAPGDNR